MEFLDLRSPYLHCGLDGDFKFLLEPACGLCCAWNDSSVEHIACIFLTHGDVVQEVPIFGA